MKGNNDIDSDSQLIPEPTLRRLPWYLAFVSSLRENNQETVSSTQISRAIGVDASQIAKDLSYLNLKGKTRIGYDINMLADRLTDFLGFCVSHNALVVGVGSLGSSLIRDHGLQNYGLNIVAGFDVNPDIVGSSICGVPVFSPDDMKSVRCRTQATIGILCVPAANAQEAADALVAAGITAIWNFTPTRVKVRTGIVIANTSIYADLALIYDRMSNN